MFELAKAIFESLQYPQRLHAALVHLPIGASVFGLILLVALALTLGRSHGLRWAAVVVFLAGMGPAFLTDDAGTEALGVLMTSGMNRTPEATAILHQHEEMGEAVWIFYLVAAGLTTATVFPWHLVRVPALVLAVTCGFAAASWVGVTGFYGGELVYVHGLGVPASPNNLPLRRSRPDTVQTQPASDNSAAEPTVPGDAP